MRKKLLTKTTWYKGAKDRKKSIKFYRSGTGANNKGATAREQDEKTAPRSVLFIEQTNGGSL